MRQRRPPAKGKDEWFYRVKINASPTTAKAAPAKLSPLGRCPVRSHKRGRMITGDVADSVAMIPVFDPCSAYKNNVIPTNNPMIAVIAVSINAALLTTLGAAGANGNAANPPIANPDAPTRNSDAT